MTTPDLLKTVAPAAASAGIKALSMPNATTGLAQGSAWKAAVPPQINDSVADKVKQLSSQDSPLMQQAKTDGLKVANRRGLLNSSMAAGASQDATLRQVLPIASQDANQAFQKNMQASDFTLKMVGQDDDQNWQSSEKSLDRTLQTDLSAADRASTEGIAKAQRDLDLLMQTNNISLQDRQQVRDISSKEGMASAERALQDLMQGRDITSREGLAAADRALQTGMQATDIASREKLASDDRTLQTFMQGRDISSREGLAAQDRTLQQTMQDKEIGYQSAERGLDRQLQEQLASWNLKSADRGAAAQMLSNMQSSYQDSYTAIMANTALDAKTREAQIVSARNLRDRNLSLVEQLFVIDLSW